MDKLDFSKPDQLQTRDGRQVRIYATDGMGDYHVHGAIKNEMGWVVEMWHDDGAAYSVIERNDLVRKPARITGWMNVYPFTNLCADRGECKKHAGGDCLGQVYIDSEIQQS